MSEAVADIIARLEQLSARERADVAYAALQTLTPEAALEDEAVYEQELQRRVAEIRAGTAVGKPAEQLFAELRQRHA